MENQLADGIRAPGVIGHDALVASINAEIAVLRAHTRRAALRPQRLDVLVVERVMQIHVIREYVLDCAALERDLAVMVDALELRFEYGDPGLEACDAIRRSLVGGVDDRG